MPRGLAKAAASVCKCSRSLPNLTV